MDARARDELRIPSICLMENAGAGAARIAAEMLAGRPGTVLCVCGPGGNGGDAMVVARHLAIAGYAVELLVPDRPGSGDPGVQMAICDAMRLVTRPWDGTGLGRAGAGVGPDLVVDGLYGTGLARAVSGRGADLIAAINAAGAPVLALDVPSGLDCDTGVPLGPCVRAAVTATFVAPKIGFANAASREWTGEVRVVGIGAPAAWPPAG